MGTPATPFLETIGRRRLAGDKGPVHQDREDGKVWVSPLKQDETGGEPPTPVEPQDQTSHIRTSPEDFYFPYIGNRC